MYTWWYGIVPRAELHHSQSMAPNVPCNIYVA